MFLVASIEVLSAIYGIALLRRPDDRLFGQHARDPHPRIWLLQRHRPRVDDAVLIMRAFPAERPLARPGGDDEIVRLLEALAVVGGADAVGELLLAAAADKARDEPALRDHVDHRQLFGEPHRVLGQRQRVAEQHDLRLLGHRGEDRGKDVAFRLHAERRVVVLVQHEAFDAHLLGVDVLLEIFVVEPAAGNRIEILVREHQRGGAEFEADIGRVGGHRLLGEIHHMHGFLLFPALCEPRLRRLRSQFSAIKPPTSRASASGCSISAQCPAGRRISNRALGNAAHTAHRRCAARSCRHRPKPRAPAPSPRPTGAAGSGCTCTASTRCGSTSRGRGPNRPAGRSSRRRRHGRTPPGHESPRGRNRCS